MLASNKFSYTNKVPRILILGLVLSTLGWAQTKPILIRGVPFELPIEIAIQVDAFGVNSKTAKEGILISGHGLRIAGATKTIPSEELACKVEARKRGFQLLEDLSEGLEWICRSGGIQQSLRYRRIDLLVSGGFIMLNNQMYRGNLRLIQDNEKLQVINVVGLDSYLAGLVNKEVRSDWPEEAVKAQIIAARSYALATAADRRKKDSLYDLNSDESDQVYDGFLPEDAQATRLVRQTEGLVIFHREEVLKAYYHSSNGGFSELPENVWGNASFDNSAYLARASPFDQADKSNEWQVQISPHMGSLLGVGRIHNMRITNRSRGQRVKSLIVSGSDGSKALSGPQFRNSFGTRWLKSTLFSIDETGVGWVLRGRGWGHGVGLSQLGARRMAKKGRTAQQILDFYYPFSNVRWIQTVPATPQSLLPKAR